jgi:hypothetical protein
MADGKVLKTEIVYYTGGKSIQLAAIKAQPALPHEERNEAGGTGNSTTAKEDTERTKSGRQGRRKKPGLRKRGKPTCKKTQARLHAIRRAETHTVTNILRYRSLSFSRACVSLFTICAPPQLLHMFARPRLLVASVGFAAYVSTFVGLCRSIVPAKC